MNLIVTSYSEDNLCGGYGLLILLVIVNPFIACLLALYFLSRQQIRFSSICTILLFACLYGYTYLTYDNDDITRHYYFFSVIRCFTTFKEFVLYETVNLSPDFGFDLIYLIVGKITSSHQVVGVIGAGMYYGLLLAIILNWLECFKSTSYQKAFLGLVFFMLAVIPSNEFNGIRQCNANALFLYIITHKSFALKKLYKQIFILFVPILLHFSLLPVCVIYVLSQNISYNKAKMIACVLIGLTIFFRPIMYGVMNVLPHWGMIGVGIATKIESYMFSGEVETALHMGSRARFYWLIVFVTIFPIILHYFRKYFTMSISISRPFISFVTVFYGYLLLTSSVYIFSRTLMLFKLILALVISFLAYGVFATSFIHTFWKSLLWITALLGIVFFIQAMEYRVVNPELFTRNLFGLFSITTDPNGTPI